MGGDKKPPAPVAQPTGWREFLERLEWSVMDYDRHGEGRFRCPDCEAWEADGHRADCQLAAMLAGAPAAPTPVAQPGWCPGCTPDDCPGCGPAARPAPVALTPAQQHAALLFSALSDIAHGLKKARIWGGMKWEYNPLHPVHYIPLRDKARAVIKLVEATGQEGGAA